MLEKSWGIFLGCCVLFFSPPAGFAFPVVWMWGSESVFRLVKADVARVTSFPCLLSVQTSVAICSPCPLPWGPLDTECFWKQAVLLRCQNRDAGCVFPLSIMELQLDRWLIQTDFSLRTVHKLSPWKFASHCFCSKTRWLIYLFIIII